MRPLTEGNDVRPASFHIYRSLFGLAGRKVIDKKFGKAVTSGKKKCLSPEERQNLKTGMDKIYPVVEDTYFTALIGQFKKADDR